MFRVRRSMMLAAGTLVSLVAASTVPAGAVPSGTAQRKALVVYVTWPAGNGLASAPADSRTLLQVTSAVGTTARNWYRTVSHGYFPGWTARGLGPVQIATPRNDQCRSQFTSDVLNRAKAAAKARGVDPANYNTTVVYFSRAVGCGWAGLSDGKDVWLHGTIAKGTVVQELGHTLQLGHGLALLCKDSAGNYVALSDSCTIVRYGDPFNAMGSGDGSFSGIQQDDLGWLTGRIRTATSDVTLYKLAPLESDPVALQVLKVPDGDGTLWLEYRRSIGVDASMPPSNQGIFIRREIPAHGRKSILLDMTPDGTFSNAPLTLGKTFTSPKTKVSITLESMTESTATVNVRTSTASKVPNVVDQTESQAKSTLQAYNYVPKVAYQLDDATCDQVGFVMRQSPAGGTTLATGSTVTIYVGRAPSGGCSA